MLRQQRAQASHNRAESAVAMTDELLLRTGRWTRPPLPFQAGEAVIDLGLAITIARGGQIDDRASAP